MVVNKEMFCAGLLALTFPDYLVLHMRKFVMEAGFVLPGLRSKGSLLVHASSHRLQY